MRSSYRPPLLQRPSTKGTEEIRNYFVALDKDGRRNTIREKDLIVLSDDAVVGVGFMTFLERNSITSPDRRASRWWLLNAMVDG